MQNIAAISIFIYIYFQSPVVNLFNKKFNELKAVKAAVAVPIAQF